VLGPLILAAIGMDLVIAPSISTGTFGVAPQDAGVASATVTVGQQLGASIGTSLLNTLFAGAVTAYLTALSLAACVPRGLPQAERDDKRKQALNRRRQPLDHAEITAAVSCRDQKPARQPGEDRGHRRAAVDAEDPRLRRRGPGDKYGPDRCHDGAAHREGQVARRRARGRFRSGGDTESRKPSQDQQDARRHADGGQARAGGDLTAAHQQQGHGHYPPIGCRVTSQHAHRLPHRAIRGRLQHVGNQPAPDQGNRRQQGCAYRPARDWPASPQKPRAIGRHWFSDGRSQARAYAISS
jgi:hypothetical protein